MERYLRPSNVVQSGTTGLIGAPACPHFFFPSEQGRYLAVRVYGAHHRIQCLNDATLEFNGKPESAIYERREVEFVLKTNKGKRERETRAGKPGNGIMPSLCSGVLYSETTKILRGAYLFDEQGNRLAIFFFLCVTRTFVRARGGGRVPFGFPRAILSKKEGALGHCVRSRRAAGKSSLGGVRVNLGS